PTPTGAHVARRRRPGGHLQPWLHALFSTGRPAAVPRGLRPGEDLLARRGDAGSPDATAQGPAAGPAASSGTDDGPGPGRALPDPVGSGPGVGAVHPADAAHAAPSPATASLPADPPAAPSVRPRHP